MKEKLKNCIEKLKGAIRSKTIWFNAVLAALISLLPSVLPDIINSIPELHPYLPDNIYKTITFLGVLGNLYLRFKTNKSLADK